MQNNQNSKRENIKRLLFTNVNQYQQQVLIPALILCLLSCIGVFYAMYYVGYVNETVAVLCRLDTGSMQHDIPWFMQLHSFNKVVPWIFFWMTTGLLIIIVWMFYVSNKLLGPSTRVLKELDEILSGQRKDPIGTRPGDQLFEDLLKRINALIQRSK